MNMETKTLLKKTIDISEKLEFNFHHIKKHLSENKYYPMLDKYKNIEQKIIQDDGKLVKKALNELEKFKPLLT